MTSSQLSVQPAHTLVWPTLQAVVELGGSATLPEITDKVVELLELPEAIQVVPHGGGPQTELAYRLAWARTYLKKVGALENSARGVWASTELGRSLTQSSADQLIREWRARLNAERGSGRVQKAVTPRYESLTENDLEDAEEPVSTWREALLERLMQLPPDAFERLASRVLREAGFVNVTVTGRTGDEGIDGTGIYQLSLVSFPVFFQCKRYRGSVGPGDIRDFRGAMQGRGDRGLVLTTGSFTSNAKAEATRAGTAPLDLIDGDRLCTLLKDYGLGVEVQQRVVEDVTLNEDFFAEL